VPYELVQSLISGLMIGSIFGVLSIGFSMTWGITHVLNVAHGAFALLAAYLGYWSSRRWGIDPVVALLGIVPLLFALGVLMHQTLIKITARRAEDLAMSSLVLTFGLAIVMETLMRSAWSSNPRVVQTSYTGKAFFVGEFAFPWAQVVSFLLAAVTIAALHLFVNRTLLGKAVRAVWQNPTGAGRDQSGTCDRHCLRAGHCHGRGRRGSHVPYLHL
jgi:branched-chain amino acid transport system permease protein